MDFQLNHLEPKIPETQKSKDSPKSSRQQSLQNDQEGDQDHDQVEDNSKGSSDEGSYYKGQEFEVGGLDLDLGERHEF